MVVNTLVVPTNRVDRLPEFFSAWAGKNGWDCIVLIEDAPTKSLIDWDSIPTDGYRHYCWQDIDDILCEDSWIISHKDSAIRCFGFLAAYHMGANYVLTMDDDCFPLPNEDYSNGGIFGLHTYHMNNHPIWIPSVRSLRSTSLHSTISDTSIVVDGALEHKRTRGLPYRNLGFRVAQANVGLWTGSGDPDAVYNLVNPVSYFLPGKGNWLVPYGQYCPTCAMNLCIARSAIPLFYFPLMGEGQPYKRMDDIWAGIIAKRCMDHLGMSLSVGEPFIEHRRASDPFKNLIDEAPGIAANEHFWEVIHTAKIPEIAVRPADVMLRLGEAIQRSEINEYIQMLGKALQVWAYLFTDKVGSRFRSS